MKYEIYCSAISGKSESMYGALYVMQKRFFVAKRQPTNTGFFRSDCLSSMRFRSRRM